MIERDPKDYTDLGMVAIEANIEHYRSKMNEIGVLLEQARQEKVFWMQVKQAKSVL